EQSLDFAPVDGFHDLDRRKSFLRHFFHGYAPDVRNVAARLRIVDGTLPGQLIAFLPVLASALAVTLAGNHGAACPFASDVAGGQAQVDHGGAVLSSFGLVFDAAGVEGDGTLGLSKPMRRLLD